MKQVIVLFASVLLGVYLFTLIAGTDEKSMQSMLKSVWVREVEVRRMVDGPGGPM